MPSTARIVTYSKRRPVETATTACPASWSDTPKGTRYSVSLGPSRGCGRGFVVLSAGLIAPLVSRRGAPLRSARRTSSRPPRSYLGSGRRPRPFRAGDACRLACRRASDVPYCLLAPCHLHRVWAFHGQAFPWVQARTCLGRGARSLSGAAHATSPVLNEANVLPVGRHSLGARP